ncbi:uncharacterized protein EV420DRAFT_1747302 [Desarmillaria tabescens]|uniref:Pali-domain-containing protein n=1 Tax=Armillaria tabescens TaxID=1929756 RepID=A0AA39KER0_ARMTA|nr:uncharacterized protein EV420DRAFT_1747302 [Desarmillaria tabescens]KAK0459627.1 hypothetical protein EV420DRAFT_1747302 [Desarmillaria tabescens]
MLASITPFVSLSAFVLLLLLTAEATNLYGVADANGSATFGVWGYCVSAIDVSIAAISQTSVSAECTDPKLGYTFNSTIAEALNVEQYADLINKGSAAALVLHPIVAAILTTIAFLIDVIVVAIIRHRVNDETDGQLQLTWGNAGVDGLGRDRRAMAWNCRFMLWHMCLRKTPRNTHKGGSLIQVNKRPFI